MWTNFQFLFMLCIYPSMLIFNWWWFSSIFSSRDANFVSFCPCFVMNRAYELKLYCTCTQQTNSTGNGNIDVKNETSSKMRTTIFEVLNVDIENVKLTIRMQPSSDRIYNWDAVHIATKQIDSTSFNRRIQTKLKHQKQQTYTWKQTIVKSPILYLPRIITTAYEVNNLIHIAYIVLVFIYHCSVLAFNIN
jgi:hypothetical protein